MLVRQAFASPAGCGGHGPRLRTVAQAGSRGSGGSGKDNIHKKSAKGSSYESRTRRRGRPAHLRSPDDTPLRDGNRDRLLGLLTDRAARTLLFYLTELNPTLHGWLSAYMKANEIPRDGNWDDVSGETFLRKLLSLPIAEARWTLAGRDEMYECTKAIGVDPRNIAQRIMEIRSQMAKEFMQDLSGVSEENALLMRETIVSSFSLDNVLAEEPEYPQVPKGSARVDPPDDSAGGGDD